MRIIHTGDLHIGKVVNNFSMLQDQVKILHEMVVIAKTKNVQAFIIAGDVYDRSIPTAEAVTVMNHFLDELKELNIEVFIISGNHDSPERISFAENILEKQSVFIAGNVKDKVKQVTIKDEYGEVIITLLPYVKPALLSCKTCEEAVQRLLKTCKQDLEDSCKRNILVTHYFVTNAGNSPELSDSETTVAVGGLDNVDACNFIGFDYVALGHIHKPQRMESGEGKMPPVIYSGAPLAYSFSECGQEKSVTLINLSKKGELSIERLPLHPMHQMRKIKGNLENLIMPSVTKLADRNDYLQVTLTDEEELIDPISTLRETYPNVMQLIFQKNEMGEDNESPITVTQSKSIDQVFSDFYFAVREKDMDEKRTELINDIINNLQN